MSAIGDRVSPEIHALNPYQPGKPIEELQRELGLPRVVKLASNEYPEGPFPEVLEALSREMAILNRYPDPTWFELGTAMASHQGLKREELLFGNGANEILELLLHVFTEPKDEVVYANPSFPIYRLLTQSHRAQGVPVPLDENHVHDLEAMAAAITSRTRLVFVCNPNNPTGTYVTAEAMAAFMAKVPADVVVVLDEAYFEFVTAKDFPSYHTLRKTYPNLVCLRSMSKAYSLAGLRVGYAMGSVEVIQLLQRVRQPFNVNRLAQVAAVAALAQRERTAERRVVTRRRVDHLGEKLVELGCKVVPSQTNFLLVFAPERSLGLFDRLLREGVIVRPMHHFGLDEGSFRVNVGTEDENEFFLNALSRVLAVSDTV